MTTVQLLISDSANREALATLLDREYTVDQSDTVGDAALYIVDDHSLPEYREPLRDQQRAVEPVFCPVVLVRRELTRVDLSPRGETDDGLLIDEVATVPVDPDIFFRRLSNLIQRRKRDEEQRLASKRHQQVMQTLPTGVVEATREEGGTFTFMNEAFVDMLNAESKAAVQAHDAADMYADPEKRQQLMAALENGDPLRDEEVLFETLDGEEFWASLTVHPYERDGRQRQIAAIRDVSERRAYRERLEETTDQLETVNRLVRHDIMNKLNVIRLTVDWLEEEVDSSAQSALDRIERSNESAIELIDQMEQIIEATVEGSAERKPVSVAEHLRAEIGAAQEAFPEATVRVSDSIPSVSVMAGDLLGSVFRNLLRNAVQHNDSDDPTVRIGVSVEEATVDVRIADNGPGIPEDRRDELFGKGNKGGESDGTGIGLYLVDTLVSQFDAEIHVTDNDPTGTVFTVRLDR